MGLKTKGIAAAAALSLMAAPAVAQDTTPTPTKSPAKLCASKSKKRTPAQKQAGQKSEFAECVSGAAKAQAEIRRNAQKPAKAQKSLTRPTVICKGKNRQRTAAQSSSGRRATSPRA